MKREYLIISSLALLAIISGVAYGQEYNVRPGDSLYRIAMQHDTTVAELQRMNGLDSTVIYPGQTLVISRSEQAATYLVKPGDNLFKIAQKHGVTVDSIKKANRLSGNTIYVGQVLRISNASTIPEESQQFQTGSYTVKKGDSLYGIAKSFGVSLPELRSVNNLNDNSLIHPGQQLIIPNTSGVVGNPYKNIEVSEEERELLTRLVYAESNGEPLEGQIAVANTVLNRVLDPRYPDTVEGVIYHQISGRYQFNPVASGRINNSPGPISYEAVRLALSGIDPSNGAKGFYNPAKTSDTWVHSQTVSARIGNHAFISF